MLKYSKLSIRHQESLFAKATALESEGISAYITAGSYGVPADTFTGSVRGDICMMEKFIGTGESPYRTAAPHRRRGPKQS